MYKSVLAAAITTAILFSGISQGQPPGITMEMVNTTLPEEGAPLAISGPYAVIEETATGSPGHVVYRPEDLSAFPARDTLPVVLWGNGGCAIDSRRYAEFLSTIASHGFLVIGTAAQPGEGRGQANAMNLIAGLNWAETENLRQGSPLNGKIAASEVAVMGQSCGGFLSIELGADPRVDTIGVFNSGVEAPAADGSAGPYATTDALADLHGPVLFINGHQRDFLMAASRANYEQVEQPAFYGARHNAGHTATVFHKGGGEFANVASNWARWILKDDAAAGAMFAGPGCGLCTNPHWDTAAKGLNQARP